MDSNNFEEGPVARFDVKECVSEWLTERMDGRVN
jgi:hypothetical protein